MITILLSIMLALGVLYVGLMSIYINDCERENVKIELDWYFKS